VKLIATLLAYGQFIYALVMFAISVAITLATRPGNQSFSSSPTYSFDNLGNNRGEGAPKTVILGKRNRVKPQITSTTITTSEGQQRFKGLYFVCRGEIASMDEDWRERLRINGVSASEFPSVKAQFRYGTADQTVIPGADTVGTAHDQGNHHLGLDQSKIHEIQDPDAETLQLLFVARGGIMKATGKGGIRPSAAGVRFEVYNEAYDLWEKLTIFHDGVPAVNAEKFHDNREADAPTLSWVKNGNFAYADIATENPEWSRVEEDGYGRKAGELFVIDETRSPVNMQLDIHLPTTSQNKGKYTKVRVTGLVENDSNDTRECDFTTVIEVKDAEADAHPGDVLMLLEGLASEEFQGGVPEVELDSTGLLVTDPRTGVRAESENPWVLLREVLTNKVWGLGLYLPEPSVLDDGSGLSWRAEMDYADGLVAVDSAEGGGAEEARYRLNYVMDVKAPANDHIAQILLSCRGSIYEVQGVIKAASDRVSSSVRTFDARADQTTNRKNVIRSPDNRSTIKIQPVPEAEIYNVVRILFLNSAEGYEKQTYTLPLNDDVGVTVREVPLELQMFGIVDLSQAQREARYHLNTAQNSTLLAEFNVGWGDSDLEPENKVTVLDDYRYPSGKVWRLLVPVWSPTGLGRLQLREANDDNYDDALDTVRPVKAVHRRYTDAQWKVSIGVSRVQATKSAPKVAAASPAPPSGYPKAASKPTSFVLKVRAFMAAARKKGSKF